MKLCVLHELLRMLNHGQCQCFAVLAGSYAHHGTAFVDNLVSVAKLISQRHSLSTAAVCMECMCAQSWRIAMPGICEIVINAVAIAAW